jgi:hypothetical protein
MIHPLRNILTAVLLSAAIVKADSLYALSSQPDDSLSLFRLDESAARLASAVTLGSHPSLVIVDLERSIVVCGFPNEPTSLKILSTRFPERVRSVAIGYKPDDLQPYGIFEVDQPGGGLALALALGRLWTAEPVWATQLARITLDRDIANPEPLSFSTLSHLSEIRFMGLVGDRFGTPDVEVPVVGENPLRLLVKPDPGASDIPAPPDWNPATKDGSRPYRILVGNDELLVLLRLRESKHGVFDLFDKQSRSWSAFAPPFPCLFVRGFGSWLAFIGSEPAPETRVAIPGAPANSVMAVRGGQHAGSAEARRSLKDGYRSSVEDVLEESGHSHSGKLLLRNQKTGAQFTIDTGEADSEIVYADDQRMIYRVNDVLFESALSGNKLLPARPIASGPDVVGVHWAFMGPDQQ